MDCCRRLNYTSPRRIADRFFSVIKRGKVKKKEEDDVAPPTHVIERSDSLSASERCRKKEANFNVAIGCFLLQLVAESKNELSRMTELRIQMESVLKNVKDELRNKDLFIAAAKDQLESNDNHSLKCDDVPNTQDNCVEGMDRLEAELEAELEYLQLHLDSGKMSINQHHETTEESTVDNSSTISDCMSNGEVIDPTTYGEEEDSSGLQSGVPPYELERRLHELLETRQAQQIRELEVALAGAKQELREKEREISWWKDTAQLMSSHVQETLGFDFQHRVNVPHQLR